MQRKTTCPSCLHAIEFDNRQGGQSVACPSCREPMRLPERMAEPSPPPVTLEYATTQPRQPGEVGTALIVMAFMGGLFMLVGSVFSFSASTQDAALICRILGWLTLAAAVVAGLCGGFMWPIRVAERRRHPHREAIKIAALCGLLFLPFWLAAAVWAHTVPEPEAPESE